MYPRIDPDKMLVQVRLPRDLVREVDHWAIDQDLYRAQAVEQLLRDGLAAAQRGKAGKGRG